jgi:DNA polymerase bacteriophage-type
MDLWSDLETYSPTPIANGVHIYAEAAEVLLWAYALGDGPPSVWDLPSRSVHRYDDLTDGWTEERLKKGIPDDLLRALEDGSVPVWFHNGGMFDFVVLGKALPDLLARVDQTRWRDTLVQALSHALPGALDKLGAVLNLPEDERKLKDGRRLVLKFCKPDAKGNRATRETDPDDWMQFVHYAARDILSMRRAHKAMPMWNYRERDIALWHLDLRTNYRGFAVDLDLADAAIRTAAGVQAGLAMDVQDLTEGAVGSANQRDALLAHILDVHGVELPDMRADTLERRLDDPDLPDAVKDLLRIRLQASMNSVAKFKALRRGVSSDGRLRGCAQFRGAGRTGRAAHRMFQPGNLPRPTMSHALTDAAIDALKSGYLGLIVDKPMSAISGTIRGAIVAPPGRKLVVADLANIEGRVAAWLAGEDWKLAAFRAYDAGTGPDLYAVAYARTFNTTTEVVMENKAHGDGLMRQIGKVMELMLQYEGGVSAFLTGAATYGIDLDAMAEAAWPTLPADVVTEAQGFLDWLYSKAQARYDGAMAAVAEGAAQEGPDALLAELEAAKLKARHGLTEKTFLVCDSIKRLWRRAHPAIASYWKGTFDSPGLSLTIERAINQPGTTMQCRRLKVRVDGSWLRIGLPSGRALCYPNIRLKGDTITYTGFNQYTKQWGTVSSYGGKFFENVTQAVAADILFGAMPAIEAEDYLPVLHVHDEIVSETPDTEDFTAARLCELMCADQGWNAGLPLAAAGFETYRYRKG